MKLKKLAVGFVSSFLFLSFSAHADIIFHAKSLVNASYCENLIGSWSGHGVMKSGRITCEYEGTTEVSPGAEPYTYINSVHMNYVSGSLFCRQQPSVDFVISGTCDPVTGKVALKSEEADLKGMMEEDGKSAFLSGTVDVGSLHGIVEKLELHKK